MSRKIGAICLFCLLAVCTVLLYGCSDGGREDYVVEQTQKLIPRCEYISSRVRDDNSIEYTFVENDVRFCVVCASASSCAGRYELSTNYIGNMLSTHVDELRLLAPQGVRVETDNDRFLTLYVSEGVSFEDIANFCAQIQPVFDFEMNIYVETIYVGAPLLRAAFYDPVSGNYEISSYCTSIPLNDEADLTFDTAYSWLMTAYEYVTE